MEGQTSFQGVNPEGSNDYSESFYVSLYGNMLHFGFNEQMLIWNRYAGFLVLQGLIINNIDWSAVKTTMPLLIALIGLVCSYVWHILNFSGWVNQNVWFSKAAKLHFTGVHIGLPTDYWRTQASLKPKGTIYQLAQLVPASLLLVYFYFLAEMLAEMGYISGSMSCALSAAYAVIFVLVIVSLFFIERKIYKDISESEANENTNHQVVSDIKIL